MSSSKQPTHLTWLHLPQSSRGEFNLNPHNEGSVVPTLQMGKPSLREFEQLAQVNLNLSLGLFVLIARGVSSLLNYVAHAWTLPAQVKYVCVTNYSII